MMDISKGRYWDKPWTLVDGCTPCSPGCDHCWSANIARRFYHQTGCLVDIQTGRFTGKIITNYHRLEIPLHRRKPTVYAVWNDLFHESVPVHFMVAAISTMAQRPDHTYLLLTKRPQNVRRLIGDYGSFPAGVWPNLYRGLTVCNQAEADEKIPVFLQVPGKKFLSIEPMLGPVDLTIYCDQKGHEHPAWISHIDAVILGGETGPGARPIKIEWVRSIRDQCQSAGVPFFFKSFGKYPPYGNYRLLDGVFHDDLPWVKV